jgi:DNA processing protein
LIKQGAKLVEDAQDILEELGAAVSYTSAAPSSDVEEPENSSPLLDAMGFDPVGLDALQARTGLDTASLQVELMTLELSGAVARLPGGLFQRMALA